MAKVSKGINTVLFFQALDDSTTDGNQLRLAFQTDHSISRERETMEEQTKDGMLKDTGNEDVSVDITSYVVRNDATHELLKRAYTDDEVLQCWEVDITEQTEDGKYPATYMQGKLTNYNTSAGTDGYTELSTTFAVNLSPRDGEVTLSPEQFTAVQYAFHDFGEFAGGGQPPVETEDSF